MTLKIGKEAPVEAPVEVAPIEAVAVVAEEAVPEELAPVEAVVKQLKPG